MTAGASCRLRADGILYCLTTCIRRTIRGLAGAVEVVVCFLNLTGEVVVEAAEGAVQSQLREEAEPTPSPVQKLRPEHTRRPLPQATGQ